MKVLQRILLDTNPKDAKRHIEAIQGQLDYYAKYRMEVEGISLISVLDLLDKKYTEESLRQNGYILTVAHLKDDAETFLKKAQDNPILYNSHLKRLYRSILSFQDHYASGGVRNAIAIEEIKALFAKKILAAYTEGDSHSKMPTSLGDRIGKQVKEELGRLNSAWYKKGLPQHTNDLFTRVFSKRLLADWQAGKLDRDVTDKLLENKQTINSIEALISCFRDKKLPETVQAKIRSALIKELDTEIRGEKMTQYDALGALVKEKRNESLQNDMFSVLNTLISEWQTHQMGTEASKRMEVYLAKVMKEMKPELDNSLTKQFHELAVNAFLDKLQDGQYKNKLSMEKYSEAVVEEELLSYDEEDNIQAFRQKVYANVMDILHDQWVSGKLTSDVAKYLRETVFNFLNATANDIKSQVWPNASKGKVQGLESQLNTQAQMIATLMQKVEALTNGAKAQKKVSEKSEDSVEKPTSTGGFSLFSK